MERNNQKSSYDVSSNVSDGLDRKESEDIICHLLHNILDVICHVLDKIVQYPEVLPFEQVLSLERIARPFDDYIQNILRLSWNITEYKIVPHQLYKLAYVGISIENVNRKGEQLEGFKEVYLITQRVPHFRLYDKFDSFGFFDHYVRLLKVLEAKRPYCIIYFIPISFKGPQKNLNFLFNIMTCSDDIFAKKIKSMNKLTLEIENLTTPVVALASDSLWDTELNSFLASHYRICSHGNVSIQLSFGWMTSFMIFGILRRLSLLSSPISALKIFHSPNEIKSVIFTDSRSLLFHGVIDAFDEKRKIPIDWQFDKELFDYALYKALNTDFQKLKNKRAKTAEARFLNLEPDSSFWDKQFEELLLRKKGTTYESIFKTSISYLKEFLAHGIERANEYEIELALKRRNSPFGRSSLDLAYSQCLYDTFCLRLKVPVGAVIAIIGFNLLEYLALFKNSGRSVNCVKDLHDFTMHFGNKSRLKVLIVSELEVLKRHNRIDLVIITQTVEGYVHTHDMLKIIEDNIPPYTPICVGIFCEELISIKRQAKHPERILGLHLWPLNRRTFVANVININNDVNSKPYISKVRAIMLNFEAICIQTGISMDNNVPFFMRSLLSILCKVSRQAMIDNMESLDEVIDAIRIAGINPNFILTANIIGFDLLWRYVELLQSRNQRLGVEWNFYTLPNLIEVDDELMEIQGDLSIMTDPPADFNIGLTMDEELQALNFTERTISMQNPSSTKILLSSFIESIIWYNENALCINENELQILNYGITAVYCYSEIVAGPFRVIDEYLHLYADIINNNEEEFKLLKDWLQEPTKFFSTSRHR